MARGDRLRVARRLAGTAIVYMHHGIDLGDGTVVHARPDDFRKPLGGGRVERTSLAAFAAGGAVHQVSEPAARFPADAVAGRAIRQVGRSGYCPFQDNCEHFANWCATGERSSRQADIVRTHLHAAAVRLAGAVSAAGLRAAGTVVGRLVARSALATPFRLGLRALLPAAVCGEAVALAAEWASHHAGIPAARSRSVGEYAGLTATAAACGATGLPAGPAGVVAAAAAGAAAWVAGGAAARWAGGLVSAQRRSG